jgi:hypothetical protein
MSVKLHYSDKAIRDVPITSRQEDCPFRITQNPAELDSMFAWWARHPK